MRWMPSVLAVLVALASLASGEDRLLSELEARELGERLLRELRWDDAIAAFAQSNKAYPAGREIDASGDSRSDEVAQALRRILDDLKSKSARHADLLPYWKFCADGYPFFSPDHGASPRRKLLEECLLSEALELCRQADPEVSSERGVLCGRVEALCKRPESEELLVLLESAWPPSHDDFGLCAFRVWKVVEQDLAQLEFGDERDAYRSRARKIFSERFTTTPAFGLAAGDGLCSFDEALSLATDRRARRWILEGLIEGGVAFEDEPKYVRPFVDCARPWLSPALIECWAIAEELNRHFDPDHLTAVSPVALRRLESMRTSHSGKLELSVATYTVFWTISDPHWDDSTEWQRTYLDDWEEESPDDPYLSWARVEVLRHRLGRERRRELLASERTMLLSFVERYPKEAIRAHCELLLAEDDLALGNGTQALTRYESVLQFDAGGVTVPGPRHADEAISAARSSLVAYCEIRDPSRLGPLLKLRAPRYGPFQETVGCGNAAQLGYVFSLRDELGLLALAGLPDEAIARCETELPLLARGACYTYAGLARDYADLCCDHGQPERIDRTLASVEALDAEEKHVSATWVTGSLRGFLDTRKALGGGDVRAVVARLRELVGAGLRTDTQQFPWMAEVELPPAIVGLLGALRREKDLEERIVGDLAGPPTQQGVLLAGASDGVKSLDYLLDVVFASDQQVVLLALARWGLMVRGEAAMRRALERLGAGDAGAMDVFREIAGFSPIQVVWRVLDDFDNHPAPDVRKAVRREQQRLRANDPWRAFALEAR